MKRKICVIGIIFIFSIFSIGILILVYNKYKLSKLNDIRTLVEGPNAYNNMVTFCKKPWEQIDVIAKMPQQWQDYYISVAEINVFKNRSYVTTIEDVKYTYEELMDSDSNGLVNIEKVDKLSQGATQRFYRDLFRFAYYYKQISIYDTEVTDSANSETLVKFFRTLYEQIEQSELDENKKFSAQQSLGLAAESTDSLDYILYDKNSISLEEIVSFFEDLYYYLSDDLYLYDLYYVIEEMLGNSI